MFRSIIRALSFILAGLFGLLALLAAVTSGGRGRPLLTALICILLAVLFAVFPILLTKFQSLASTRVGREPEHSKTLRALTFAAQVAGILALAQPTQLWLPAIIAIVGLAFGHRHAYLHRVKPNRVVWLLSFLVLHL